jgi:hypothetical protein
MRTRAVHCFVVLVLGVALAALAGASAPAATGSVLADRG